MMHSSLRRQRWTEAVRAWVRKGCGIAVVTAVLVMTAPFVNTERTEERVPPIPADRPARVDPPAAESRVAVKWRHGDTFISMLKRFGIERPSAHALVAKVRPFVNLRKIQPGDDVHVVLNTADRTVEGLELVVDDDLVRIKATVDGWSAEREKIPSVRENRVIRGEIRGSLYESGVEAGLSPQQILDLAKIFESDIDFFSDFQPHDVFNIVVEEVRYANGRRAPGRVLAAELEAAKESFDAFYYGAEGSGEYYNSKGEALRRAFLRAPLSYARISSPFNRNRMHPIFRKVRPHLAIDYAAPAGSPVVAIGRGTVAFVGWRGGYGKVVDIRHTGNYLSRYAHFSRFASKLRKGQAVDAGDVIGYVGQTGHATGPHLHFEFLRAGTKINFLDLRIPKTQQLSGAELARFHRLREQQQALLRRSEPQVVEATRHGL